VEEACFYLAGDQAGRKFNLQQKLKTGIRLPGHLRRRSQLITDTEQ
jgi:hypothetical protein